MGLRDSPRVLLNAAKTSAMPLYIIADAILFSFLLTSENIPQAMAAWIVARHFQVRTFLIVVNLVLLLVGNVMEATSILLIMAPILFSSAKSVGVDPVQLGVSMAVNMEVGLCHPPVGLNLYVASGITRMVITELTGAVWPWLVAMLAFLVPVTYVPGIAPALPHLFGMG